MDKIRMYVSPPTPADLGASPETLHSRNEGLRGCVAAIEDGRRRLMEHLAHHPDPVAQAYLGEVCERVQAAIDVMANDVDEGVAYWKHRLQIHEELAPLKETLEQVRTLREVAEATERHLGRVGAQGSLASLQEDEPQIMGSIQSCVREALRELKGEPGLFSLRDKDEAAARAAGLPTGEVAALERPLAPEDLELDRDLEDVEATHSTLYNQAENAFQDAGLILGYAETAAEDERQECVRFVDFWLHQIFGSLPKAH